MANTVFQLKRSSVAGKQPNTSTLSVGELAINLTDKKIYSSDGSNIFEPAANVTNLNVTGGIYANGSYGSDSQVLTSNGSVVYWANAATGGGDGGGSVNVSASSGYLLEEFTGDGSTNTYILTNSTNTNNALVAINGVLQEPGDAYTISGTTLTFSENIANNATIDVRIPQFEVDAFISSSNTLTTTNTSQQTVDSFNKDTYRSISYLVEVTDNTNNNYHIQNITLLHDNSTVYMSEFGAVYSNGSPLATFDSSISGTNVLLLATPVTADSTIRLNRYSVDSLVIIANTDTVSSTNTAANYSWTGLHVFNSNVTLNGVKANGSIGAAGQVLTSNGTSVYWSYDDDSTAYANAVSYVDTEITTVYSNATSYADSAAGTAYSNATSYADTAAGTAYSNAVSYADTVAGTAYSNSISYSSNADNISSGTLSEARLPYRMDQDVQTTDNVQFANLTLNGIIANNSIGSNGQVLTTNGTSVYWSTVSGGGGGGGSSYNILTSNTNLVNITKYLVDTSSGSVYLTLPSSPSAGDNLIVGDGGGDKYTNPAYILRNGSTIDDVADDLQLDIPNTKIELVYTGSTWKVFS